MVESDSSNSSFGWSVSAGDFNGDGYGDLVVGAPDYDFIFEDDGKVFVYFGGPAGPSTTADWVAETDQSGAKFGYTVAAGDFNDDGYDDLVVGATMYDNGIGNEGVVFVWLGGDSGLVDGPGTPSNASWFAESDWGAGRLGTDAHSAGDVNGDGYDDLIACGDGIDSPGKIEDGAAFVWHGGPAGFVVTSGTRANAAWEHFGGQNSAWLRQSVGAGDVNGDGYDEVMVGLMGYDGPEDQEGQVRVFFGSASGLNSSPGWTMEPNDMTDRAGKSVAGVGDVNNDGYDDVLISGLGAFLYYGSATGLGPNGDLTNYDWRGSGTWIQEGGDINNDGIDDILMSSNSSAMVHVGSDTGVVDPRSWIQSSPVQFDGFGGSAWGAGDVNGDGYGDVIVGAKWHSNGQDLEGAAYLYLGVVDITVPALVHSHTARWVEGRVEVEWILLDVEGALEFSVIRRGPGTDVRTLIDPLIESRISILGSTFVLRDPDTRPGEAYVYRVGIHEDGQLVSSFETKITTAPMAVELFANYPNPFNPATTIRFSLAEDTDVSLAIYDAAGRLVRVIADRPMQAGVHSERWDGAGVHGSRCVLPVCYTGSRSWPRTNPATHCPDCSPEGRPAALQKRPAPERAL
jgi:hypothetical protein